MAADTTVTRFDSTQTGAPTLNNTAGSLIAVLDACLVDGFGLKAVDSVVITDGVGVATISTGHAAIEGSVVLFAGATGTLSALNGRRKVTSVGTYSVTFDASDLANGTATGTITMKQAGAGWSKAFSGTNLAAYKSANVQASGCLLRVDDTTTTYASVRGCEAMTDINTYSGVIPTTTQQATNCFLKSSSATAKPWRIFANDRVVYLAIAPDASYPTAFFLYGFGDAVSRKAGDAWRFFLIAASSTSISFSSNYNPLPVTTGSFHSKYMARSYSALGSAVAVTQTWFGSAAQSGTSGNGGSLFPNPADNAIDYTPIVLLEGTGYRGALPGVFATPQDIQAGVVDSTILKDIPGLSGALIYQQNSLTATTRGGLFFDLTGPWSV